MLKEVLSISGKPGLFKLVSQGKNMYIAESLNDNKRIPIYPRDKVVSLGDIAIYTETEEVPLSTVLSNVYTKENGEPVNVKPLSSSSELIDYFKLILPDFDRERVYPSDIKKIINWYNILINAGFNSFEPKEKENTSEPPHVSESENEENSSPADSAEEEK